MQTFSMDPSILCLVAIFANNARAVRASVDAASSVLVKGAAYVVATLVWNIATKKGCARLGHVAGVKVAQGSKPIRRRMGPRSSCSPDTDT